MLRTTLSALIIVTIFCQIGVTQSSFSGKYHSVTLGFGPRILDTTPGTILATYVDDSPSMDNLSTTTEVLDKYSTVGINIAYHFAQFNGLSHSLSLDGSLGKNDGYLLYYSLGYSFSKEIGSRFLVARPSLNIGFGVNGFDVGEIENNASYIQIGNDQYYSSTLDLNLHANIFIGGPSVDLQYMVGEQFMIFANVAYDIATTNSNPKLVFKTPNTNSRDDSRQTSVDIDGTNPLVTYNGEKITTLPYEATGIRATFGVGYVWGR